MRSRSMIFSFFRFLLLFLILLVVALLYWSSLSVEEDLKVIKRELAEMKQKEKMAVFFPKEEEKKAPVLTDSHLLTPDLFLQKTLPALLKNHFQPQGDRRENVLGRPDHLYPFSEFYMVAQWNAMCNFPLVNSHTGIYESYAPGMAVSMELKTNADGEPEYWMKLRENVFWEPLKPEHFSSQSVLSPHFLKRHPVTAHDYKFFYDAVMNPHVEQGLAVSLRGYLSTIEEVRVENDFTLVVKWKLKEVEGEKGKKEKRMKYMAKSFTASLMALPCFVYQYFMDGTKILEEDEDPNTYRTNAVWAQNFSRHWASQVIVSCGPWIFDGMDENSIRFLRNPHYFAPFAVLSSSCTIQFSDSTDAIWNRFKVGSIDQFEIPPHQLPELDYFLQTPLYKKQKKEGKGIEKIHYLYPRYAFVAWNQKNPLFTQAKVRQALTMAIDRKRMIQQHLHGMGIETTGTFFPLSPSYDSTIAPYPYDPELAKKYLQEEGWRDHDGDGILDKKIGDVQKNFSFSLCYFVKNPTSKAVCEFISTTLKEVGIECRLKGIDVADLSDLFDTKDFDALFLEWVLGSPPEDPRQLWHSEGAALKGSSNIIGFRNKEVDAIIDLLDYEEDKEARIALYHRFDKILHEEAPYTFLYTPKATLLYREYLQNVFIPADRQDLIPGANVGEPQKNFFWIQN